MFGAKNLLPCLATNHFQFYYHTIPNFTIISKSTIHCLILLLSTTISHSTIYHLFATKTTILPYHSQLYHHIQVYHLLPFCYKKNYHTYHIIPNLPITTNSTIYQNIARNYLHLPQNHSQFYHLLLIATDDYLLPQFKLGSNPSSHISNLKMGYKASFHGTTIH